MSTDSKRFPINLSNCRSRKSSIDSRPRTDSSSSSQTFKLKNSDFAFGESLHPQKRVNTVAINDTKNSDIHFSADMVIEETIGEDEDYIQLARSIAEQNEGYCLSETCENYTLPLEFKCKMGHMFKSSEVLSLGTWCMKCKNLLIRAQHYAQCFGGTCNSKIFQILLDFSCKNNHEWKADASRYMNQQWCKECSQAEKTKKKGQVLNEISQEENELLRIQEGLFQQAKSKLNTEFMKNTSDEEENCESLTEEMTKNYLQTLESYDLKTMEQVSCVYKVICLSEQSIRKKYFAGKSKDQITGGFRQFARNLHPDKNKHPYAGEAFQRISALYAAAMAEM